MAIALRHPLGSRVLIVGHGGIVRAAIPALCRGTLLPDSDLPNRGIAALELHPAPPGATCILKHWPLALTPRGGPPGAKPSPS